MLNDNGTRVFTTADLKARGIYKAFRSATAINGWQHQSQGNWRGDESGISGLTISEWVSRQKLVRTANLLQATGLSRAYLNKVGNDNDLKPVAKGRWRIETASKLLQQLGRLAHCPKCQGVAAIGKQGEVTCLECE